jgi:hypothetical protein
VGGLTTNIFDVPSSAIPLLMLLQFRLAMLLVFTGNVQPVEGEGYVAATVFVAVRVMESNGAPGVCTAVMTHPNPPCNV